MPIFLAEPKTVAKGSTRDNMANPLMWYIVLGGAVILLVALLFVVWRSGSRSGRQLYLGTVERMHDVAAILEGAGFTSIDYSAPEHQHLDVDPFGVQEFHLNVKREKQGTLAVTCLVTNYHQKGVWIAFHAFSPKKCGDWAIGMVLLKDQIFGKKRQKLIFDQETPAQILRYFGELEQDFIRKNLKTENEKDTVARRIVRPVGRPLDQVLSAWKASSLTTTLSMMSLLGAYWASAAIAQNFQEFIGINFLMSLAYFILCWSKPKLVNYFGAITGAPFWSQLLLGGVAFAFSYGLMFASSEFFSSTASLWWVIPIILLPASVFHYFLQNTLHALVLPYHKRHAF